MASHQRWHRPGTAATASGTNSYSTDKCKPRPKPSEQSRIPSVHCSSGPETILERASTNSAEPERAQDFESLQARQTMQRPDSSLSQTGEITVNSQSQEAILLPHNSKTANISLSFQLFEAVSPVRKQSDIFPSLPEHKVPIMTQHWHRQPEEALAINGQTVDKQSDPHLSHDIPHSRAIPDATRESSHPEDRNIILCSIDLTGSKQTGSVNSNERHAVGSFGNGSVSKSSFSVDALLA
ncbi:unnamed protein product [Protopolystoma xenopodis]|uniref:Uncharacterized protein n=1 Tax=Protopolystoma xenopodis TaxID=117903 RepID=A0A448WRK7_9PLAT|nr:unnamed protein product [Protopolystoma xenopodis]